MPDPLEYYTPQPDPMPGDLKAVAWVFIGFGILYLLDTIFRLANGACFLNFGVLELPAGWGMLYRNARSRDCGLIFIWIKMIVGGIGLPVAVASAVGGRDPLVALGGAVLCIGLLALSIWQYRVLTRPDVRRLFGV